MADVTSPGERAQLLLITAIALGLLLVVLAVMLNTVMYTDALAAGGAIDGAERDLTAYLDGMDAGIGVLLGGVNADRPAAASYDELEDATTVAIGDWSDQERAQWVTEGTLVDVTVTDVAFHTRIIDDNGSSDFTDAAGEVDWTLFDEGGDIDTFELNVTRVGLTTVNETCGPDDGCFTIVIEGDAGMSSTIRIAEQTGEIAVDISTPDGETTCTIDTEAVTIDLVNGTIDGQRCDGLAVADRHQSPMRLQYADASNVTGTYVVGFDGVVADEGRFTEEKSPRFVPSVSWVEVAVTYQSTRLAYTGTHTITAGEYDD